MEIKNRKNNSNKIPNSSQQAKKNTLYKNLNNNKDNFNNLKYSQNRMIGPEKLVQRNQSSINKKSESIKFSHNDYNNYNQKQNIRRMYKEKNLNNLSHNKGKTANKSINDSKQKSSINKNYINRHESLNKILLSSNHNKKTINKIPSSLEKKVNSYLIPKIQNNNLGFNSKTQINKVGNKLYNNYNLNQNNNINNINNSNNTKFINVPSKKKEKEKENENNLFYKYLNQYNQQKNKDNSFDYISSNSNINNKINKNKKIKEIKVIKDTKIGTDINANNKYHYNKDIKNENINYKNTNNDQNNSNNKKIYNNNLNYINYINNDFQKRNKTVIGKKNVISMLNGPYIYNLNENKNDFEPKNNSIVNTGKYSFQNRKQDNNKININNIDINEKDDKNNDNDKQIIKKINNIIEQLKIDKRAEFIKNYGNQNNINTNNENLSNFLNKNKTNIKDNEIDFQKYSNNDNKIFKNEEYKSPNYYNIFNKDKSIKNDLEPKQTIENEIDSLKTKENNTNYNNAFNLINKYNNSIIKRSSLNNGQDNTFEPKEKIINNNINNTTNNILIGESIQQNDKKDIIQSINKNQINLLNNRNQNNEIIKIDVKNLKGIYQNKRDLNKIKNNEIETAKATQKDTENIREKENKKEKENIQITPETITQSLIGLVNLGETCYMNTGLQNIIHCKPFIKQLFSILSQFKDSLDQKIITYSFINLCASLIKNKNNKYSIINSYDPSLFKRVFCNKHKEYADRGQHDSLEFLRILLDDISKELNQTKIISKYKELKTEGKSKEAQNYEYNKFYLCRENSIVVKVFYSQIMNVFTCECGDISYSFEKILDIPLLFPKDIKNEINLNDLLEHYFDGEKLSWSLPCQKCGQRDIERSKKIKLSILPEVIIFSLQRFNPITGVKINKIIKFEEIIDLKPFCDYDFFNGEINTRYRLFGISNHSGTINFGHYYSYTKVGENWYEFNDSFVKQIHLILMSRGAYFFFYERIE